MRKLLFYRDINLLLILYLPFISSLKFCTSLTFSHWDCSFHYAVFIIFPLVKAMNLPIHVHIISESNFYIIDVASQMCYKREEDVEIQYKIRTCSSSMKQFNLRSEHSLFILKQKHGWHKTKALSHKELNIYVWYFQLHPLEQTCFLGHY